MKKELKKELKIINDWSIAISKENSIDIPANNDEFRNFKFDILTETEKFISSLPQSKEQAMSDLTDKIDEYRNINTLVPQYPTVLPKTNNGKVINYFNEICNYYNTTLIPMLEHKREVLYYHCEIKQITKTVTSFNWQGTPEQLQKLYNLLLHKFIDGRTDFDDFKNAFYDEFGNSHKSIKWIGTDGQIVYLFEQLRNDFIPMAVDLQATIKHHFINQKEQLFKNLKQAKQNYLNNKNALPKRADVIDTIISNLQDKK